MRSTSKKNLFASLVLSAMLSTLFVHPAQCSITSNTPPEELRAIAKSVDKLTNPTPDQLLDQANAYRWLKDYKSAIRTLDKLVLLKPNSGAAHAFRGVMYKFEKRNKEAKEELNKAEKLGYRKTNLYAERSVVLLCMSDWTGALEDANRAAELEPTNPNHLVLAADARAKLGKPEDGLVDVNKALALEPNNASALAVRAWIYDKLGRKKEARDDSNRARSLGWESP